MRHTIDDSSRGADGVRLLDVNGDQLSDVATGWEEGGKIRLYLNPGPKQSRTNWPAVTVGNVRSPEDAVFVDLDGDGAVDVVSSCEGRNRTVYVHWAPTDRERYRDPNAWKTEALPASKEFASWMFCLPLDMDGRRGVDLVVGSKGKGAAVGWFESPEDPRDLKNWKWRPIYEAGWIMSLFSDDVDGDGDTDVLTTDRKGANRGVWWLENPGVDAVRSGGSWKSHAIGGRGKEVMFMRPVDLNGDGSNDVVCATRNSVLFLKRKQTEKRRGAKSPPEWDEHEIELPAGVGTGKGVHASDLDLDDRIDVVLTCENAKQKSGVVWLSQGTAKPGQSEEWTAHEISGRKEGVKFDRIELLDLDGDGDLDVLTCEERDNLGVVWYENPTR